MKEKHHWLLKVVHYVYIRLFFSVLVQMSQYLLVRDVSGE